MRKVRQLCLSARRAIRPADETQTFGVGDSADPLVAATGLMGEPLVNVPYANE